MKGLDIFAAICNGSVFGIRKPEQDTKSFFFIKVCSGEYAGTTIRVHRSEEHKLG